MNCKVEDNVSRGFPRQDWASGLCQRGSWDPLVFDFFQSCELAPRQRAFAQDVPAVLADSRDPPHPWAGAACRGRPDTASPEVHLHLLLLLVHLLTDLPLLRNICPVHFAASSLVVADWAMPFLRGHVAPKCRQYLQQLRTGRLPMIDDAALELVALSRALVGNLGQSCFPCSPDHLERPCHRRQDVVP